MGSVDELQNAEEAVAQLQEERAAQEQQRDADERHREPVRPTARLERHFQAIDLTEIATMTNMRPAVLPAIQELALSIRENGLLQPPTVREFPDGEQPYQLVFGRRRFEALRILVADGLLDEPIEFEVINGLSTIEAMTMMAVENLQREDPEPLQFARMLRIILREDPELTAAGVARSWGISPSKARSFLRLLNLSPAIQERLDAGDLSFTTADLLRRAVDSGRIDEEQAETLAGQAAEGELSATALRREAGYIPEEPEGYQAWAEADDARRIARARGERVSDEVWEITDDDDDEVAELGIETPVAPTAAPTGPGQGLAIPPPTRLPAAITAARQARVAALQARGEFRETSEGLEALDEEASDDQLDAYLLGWLLTNHAPAEYLIAFELNQTTVWSWAYELEAEERLRRLRDLSLIILAEDPEPPAVIFPEPLDEPDQTG